MATPNIVSVTLTATAVVGTILTSAGALSELAATKPYGLAVAPGVSGDIIGVAVDGVSMLMPYTSTAPAKGDLIVATTGGVGLVDNSPTTGDWSVGVAQAAGVGGLVRVTIRIQQHGIPA